MHNIITDVEPASLHPRANLGRAILGECPEVVAPVITDQLKWPEDYDLVHSLPIDTYETHDMDFSKIYKAIYKLHCDTQAIEQAVQNWKPDQGLTFKTVDRKMVIPNILFFDTTCQLAMLDMVHGYEHKKPKGSDRPRFISYGHSKALIEALDATLKISIPNAVQAILDKRPMYESVNTYPEQGNDLVIDSLSVMMQAWDDFTNRILSYSYRRDGALNGHADNVTTGVNEFIRKAIESVR